MSENYLNAPPKTAFGGTFSNTMWVLGTLATLQIVAVGWAVVKRPSFQTAPMEEVAPVVAAASGDELVPVAAPSELTDPASAATPAIPVLTNPQEIFSNPATPALVEPAPPVAAVTPTPIPAAVPSPTPGAGPGNLQWGNLLPNQALAANPNLGGLVGLPPLSESLNQAAMQPHAAHEISEPAILQLIAEGSEKRSEGDMNGALKAYRRAAEILPNHPRILSEMAVAYNQMGRPDKSTELWEQIYRLGNEGAGGYFAIADQQLRGQGIEVEQFSASRNILKIDSVVPTKDPTSVDGERVNLRVTVGGDPATRPVGTEMTLHVYFYDDVDGEDFEPSTANTESNYPTEPYDWSSRTEVVDVTYHQPIFTDVQRRELGERNYYGYIIELYYRGELQERIAAPATLEDIVPGEKTEMPKPVIGPDPSLFPTTE